VQEGTIPPNPGATQDYGWWEMTRVSRQLNYIPFWLANVGTSTNMTLQAAYHDYGTDYYTFYAYNAGTGNGADFTEQEGSSERDSSTGEFITERPKVNQSVPPLMEFNSPIVWDHAWVNNQGTSGALSNFNHIQLTMNSDVTHLNLTHPGSLYNSSQQFNQYYDGCSG
jgi:hypothetical protein